MSSRLARNGSVSSISSTRYAIQSYPESSIYAENSSSSTDSSSHHHILSHLTHLPSRPSLPHSVSSWFHESFAPINHRHERIALGHIEMGMAVLTREMMEMQIQQAPNVRGMMDCLPTKQPERSEMGWRVKLGTWPLSKHEATVARKFSA